MDQIKQLLALMDRPAFFAENGQITAVNDAARSLQVPVQAPVGELMPDCREAYAEFHSGFLAVELELCGCAVPATVTALETGHLFTLEPAETPGELRMLSLAAQILREPLSDVMAVADSLPAETEHLPELSRGLHRLLRIVGNMTAPPPFHPEMMELNALLREVWEKAENACASRGIRLDFRPSPAPVYSAVDGAMLTRAVHNLLSNSMKFSQSRTLRLELLRTGKYCRIRFRDPGAVLSADPFSRYLREPGLEDPRQGLGMGMQLIRSAAAAHGGTMLMVEHPEGGLLTELCLPIRQDSASLRSPRLRLSYTGERDALLVELSDVLPPEFYK